MSIAFDEDRLPFVDVDGKVDGVLLVVQLDVERRHLGVGIPAVLVERDDPLQVGVELLAREVVLGRPRAASSSATSPARTSTARLDGLDARELQVATRTVCCSSMQPVSGGQQRQTKGAPAQANGVSRAKQKHVRGCNHITCQVRSRSVGSSDAGGYSSVIAGFRRRPTA